MQRMAEFSKVSFEQFREDWLETYYESDDVDQETENYIRSVYDGIKLPTRSTIGSAGYDFHIPVGFTLKAGHSIKIITGIRCEMYDGWVLLCFPRSSLGFKYGLHYANGVPVIDGDYAYADNEGNIAFKLVNDSSFAQDIHFETGDKFCQGIFVPFGVTRDDNVMDVRCGGIGSTGR